MVNLVRAERDRDGTDRAGVDRLSEASFFSGVGPAVCVGPRHKQIVEALG